MSIIKDEKRNTWSVSLRYQDQYGNNKRKYKRGFKNKKEAQSYKYEFLIKARKEKKLNMSMDAFFKIYLRDKKHKVKASTYRNIKSIYKNSIQKTFGKKEMEKITSRDILKWQNDLSKQNYKPTTLRSYNNTLSAIFNHAYRYYELSDNPNKKVVAMGQEDSEVMKFWTLEEFNQFIACIENQEEKLYFNILFYTGIRLGEFLALRLKDIDLKKGHIFISRTATFHKGEFIFTKPKTSKSQRIVTIPNFLITDIKKYIETLYKPDKEARLFETTGSILRKSLTSHSKRAGVKVIRIHDLRHSHASFLIEKGIQPSIVQSRLGHEKIETTLKTYAHLYPNKQYELAHFIDSLVDENIHQTRYSLRLVSEAK